MTDKTINQRLEPNIVNAIKKTDGSPIDQEGMTNAEVLLLVGISSAISLKRIADALDGQSQEATGFAGDLLSDFASAIGKAFNNG